MVIKTDNGSGVIKGVNALGRNAFEMGFSTESSSGNSTGHLKLFSKNSGPSDGDVTSNLSYGNIKIESWRGLSNPSYTSLLSPTKIYLHKDVFDGTGNKKFTVETEPLYFPNVPPNKNILRVSMSGLPTTNTNLYRGDIWVDSKGYLKIVK